MAPKRNRFVFTVGMVSRLVATAEEDRLRLPAQGRLRPSQFYRPFTSVVQKIALTAIVDQADNSTWRVAGLAFSAGCDGGRKPMRGRIANAKSFGWAIYAAGFAIWLFGCLSTGHAAAFDWAVATPSWISSFVPNLEAEVGLALMFASMIPIYWRAGRKRG
jgi:hypothetical protein